MCAGEVSDNIFSDEFIKCRCAAHGVTIDEYSRFVIEPLQALLKNKFLHIIMWFDDDMFCQINLITLLGYLDQINYDGKITFNLISRQYKETPMVKDSFELMANGYKDIYRQVLIDRCAPENINISVMRNGINLYLQYIKEDNEITEFIRQNSNLASNLLLVKLLNSFPQYGLGDTQYKLLIERYK